MLKSRLFVLTRKSRTKEALFLYSHKSYVLPRLVRPDEKRETFTRLLGHFFEGHPEGVL